MQAITRTELKWLVSLLDEEIKYNESIMTQLEGTPDAYIAELRRDGLRNILRKLQIAHGNGDKRIAID